MLQAVPDEVVEMDPDARQAKIDELILKMQIVDKERNERRRQSEKNRRNAVQASRKKNRRKTK